MKLNFYENYLQKNLEIELEKLDLNSAKELLTKRDNSDLIKGTRLLFKKDLFYRFIPFVIVIALICFFYIGVNGVLLMSSIKLKYLASLESYDSMFFVGFLLSFFYIVYFGSQRNKVITIMLNKKILELEKDIFGYKKINRILTKN